MTTRDPFYLSWRAKMPSRPDPIDPEYLDTPYLTAAVNICSALGVFVGAWTALLLAEACIADLTGTGRSS
jgi:hypothetical protein